MIAEATKFCKTCKTEKPISEWGKLSRRPDGLSLNCLSCEREKRRKKRSDPVEHQKMKDKGLRAMVKYRYGITKDVYDGLMNAAQFCSICGLEFSAELRKVFDHDHKTEKFRGVLCSGCNSALGCANDDIKILQKALDYLAKTEAVL